MREWLNRAGLVAVVAAGLLLNLGSGGGEDRTKAHVRLVNASGSYPARQPTARARPTPTSRPAAARPT